MAGPPDKSSPIVGLSSNVLEPAFGGGRLDGIGVYTLALERGLAGLGVQTRRIGAPRRHGGRLLPAATADLAFATPLGWSMAAASLLRVAAPGSAAVEAGIDVYHATDYMIPRLRRTPVAATLYDAIPLAHPEWANPTLRTVKNLLMRSAAARADLVLAISDAAVDEIVDHYRIPRERVRVVPLGVDADWFVQLPDAQVAASLARHRVRPGSLLFVGTLQPRKNLETLVAAYDRLPAARRAEHPLVIAGKYGWGADALRADLQRRQATGEVRWLDYVERDDLRALYASAQAFVFPSLSEGFGLPVLEALAAGTPVIASDLPVLREVAGDAATYFAPRDADALADALSRACDDGPDEAARARRRLRAARFDWSACARGTLDAYRELISRKQ